MTNDEYPYRVGHLNAAHCKHCGFNMQVGVKQILKEVAIAHGLSIESMMARSRRPKPAHARFCAFNRLHQELGLGPSDIAAIFGMDHSSVIHGINRADRWYEHPSTTAGEEPVPVMAWPA